MRAPSRVQKLNGHHNKKSGHYWHDDKRKSHQINLNTGHSRFSIPQQFAYSPATEDQVRETEHMLGFPLYPCAREIYTHIANGGFGPGYGIGGILGGGGNGGLGPMVERHVESRRSHRFIGPEVYASQAAGEGDFIEFPHYTMPQQFLEFCHWGCAIYSYLDNSTGCMYRLAYEGISFKPRYQCEAPSLETWLKRWIAGSLV